jgi:hypothetical protein
VSFFGCVVDLLWNIHGINNYSFIKPGRRERREKEKGYALHLRVHDRHSFLETHS